MQEGISGAGEETREQGSVPARKNEKNCCGGVSQVRLVGCGAARYSQCRLYVEPSKLTLHHDHVQLNAEYMVSNGSHG